MGSKLSAIGVILAILLLIVAFVLYVYMFSPYGNGKNLQIILPARIEGISVGSSAGGDFEIPEDAPFETVDLLSSKIERKIKNSDKVSGEYGITIEKLDVDNETIPHSNDLKQLKENGWLLLPWTYKKTGNFFSFLPWVKKESRGEAIVVCYRRFYGSTHPKTCINNDKLEKGDVIIFDKNRYYVETVALTNKTQETLFDNSADDYLKIITNSGNDKSDTTGNTKYLVVIAKKAA